MTIHTIQIDPFSDQRPGTSGLRKTTRAFEKPHYLAAFIQAAFNVLPPAGPIVLGGDGRYFNDQALWIILKVAAANGCPRAIVGEDGLLSTPAASHLIRSRGAALGLILSASHNPGGPDGDFGVKLNGPNGAPASEELTEAIFRESCGLTAYRIADLAPFPLTAGEHRVGDMVVEVVDSTRHYADLMESLFDFDRIGRLLQRPDFALAFDAMNAVTGPYAREIFVNRLAASNADLLGEHPLADFGGLHPDPNPTNARRLMARMSAPGAPAFGAASDGDGDRHLIVGPRFAVNPSDSLAILAANAELVPGYRGRLTGVARSMPTSRAVDKVAETLGIDCYETPTGWKYFGSLLDAGKITLCGEESAGAGSDHVREKDGVWAVLFWLNVMAQRDMGVEALVRDHWRRFGRHAHTRVDYELSSDAGEALIESLRERLPRLPGETFGERQVLACGDFDYVDPVNGSTAVRQGIQLHLNDGGRIVVRLSGTGTSGATLRVYLEQFTPDPHACDVDGPALTAPLRQTAEIACRIDAFMEGAAAVGLPVADR